MTIRIKLAAISALGLLMASPASATWGGSSGWGGSSSSGGHTHHCGCGHKGWDCKPGSSSGGSSSSSGSSGGGSSGGSSGGGSSGGTPVPEPADFALFAAGVLGLIIGRRSSRARHR
jgi:hypothetical protein